MITVEEYLMGRDKIHPLDDEMKLAAQTTVQRVNSLMDVLGIQRGVRSGYRPPSINGLIPGASKNSRHMVCEAVDLEDNDGKFKTACLKNLAALEDLGLWMESPEFTSTWCHLQVVPPRSGHRVFIP